MAFLAKQVVGSQLSSAKADISGSHENLSSEERAKLEEEEEERLAALQEAEELRKKKHDKLEGEREKMRQGVREKYSIRKVADTSGQGGDLRRQQEAEMAEHIAAMDPKNVSVADFKSKKVAETANQAAANAEAAEEDLTSKLMRGNVSGAAAQVATKVQALLPQGFSVFKGKD